MHVPDVWGNIVVGEAGTVRSLSADHITGIRLLRDAQGRPAAVGVQWMQDDGEPTGLTMDFANAMWLLSCLKSMQLDLDAPFPEDPRDPTWTASQYKSKK